jgi:hypothetical protein
MSIFSRRSILSRFVASVPALAIAGSVAPAAAIEAEGLTAPSRDRALMVLFSQFEAALAELKAARENKASCSNRVAGGDITSWD